MEAIQHPYSSIGYARPVRHSILYRFIEWCKIQEKNRLLWVAVVIAGHGCFITPLTAMFVMFGGNSMFFWALVIAAMTMSVVVNLAALPTKYTIPVFFASLLIDLFVIVSCIAAGLSFPGS